MNLNYINIAILILIVLVSCSIIVYQLRSNIERDEIIKDINTDAAGNVIGTYMQDIQFVIMNGLYEKKTPHEILMKFKENYSKNDGDNEFMKKHRLSSVVFGEPSVILDNEDVDKMKTLADEKADTRPMDAITFENLESNYKRVAYFGCDIATDNIKNDTITQYTPLSEECEDSINRYIRGF